MHLVWTRVLGSGITTQTYENTHRYVKIDLLYRLVEFFSNLYWSAVSNLI